MAPETNGATSTSSGQPHLTLQTQSEPAAIRPHDRSGSMHGREDRHRTAGGDVGAGAT